MLEPGESRQYDLELGALIWSGADQRISRNRVNALGGI